MSNQLIDPFGREVNYLRVSVTDRCDFRCTYCMSENMTFLPKKDILSLEELEIICNVFIKLGTKKIRLTGGEPLVRKGILNLIKNLGKKIGNGLDELTLTTNGSQLQKYAEFLKENGVNRVNVSLDHLDPSKFREITRWGDLDKVLVGIEKAKSVGIKVKINTVALKDFNEKNIIEMIEWCSLNEYDMTLIEVMPMGDIGSENRFNQYLPLSKVKEKLSKKFKLINIPKKTGGPARYYKIEGKKIDLGFITPLTHNFCESCNRVRLTCTGILYMCLGQDDNVDLKNILRNKGSSFLEDSLFKAISKKPKGHDFNISKSGINISSNRHMSVTGG
ncbi:MAG: cyclic pyranopterin monophosphate synthase [Alphaproteobacteria bacterium]|nr:MAG: cyclic pyranopterin monophosphate synthase [Alphaproteobacteria bacterium]